MIIESPTDEAVYRWINLAAGDGLMHFGVPMTATWINGHIVFDAAPTWPDGCRLSVEPAAQEATLGIREEDWPTDAEGRAAWLAWYDSLEPLEMTAQEERDLQAWRQKVKEYTLANMSEHVEGLFK